MAKQSVSIRGTHVGATSQIEKTLSVEDNLLPTPQELSAYQQIDPNLVKLFIDTAREEQKHRIEIENKKIQLLEMSERKNWQISKLGMFFAFLSLLGGIGISALALYLDKPWFAGIFGFASIVSIVSIFINAGKEDRKGA